MSVTVKTYLNFSSSEPEIRRFAIDTDASTSYDYLVEKIRSVYPKLTREDFQLFWKGSVTTKYIFSFRFSIRMLHIDISINLLLVYILQTKRMNLLFSQVMKN
jgi:hypothetical protein